MIGFLAGLLFRWNMNAWLGSAIAGAALGVYLFGVVGWYLLFDFLGSIIGFLLGSVIASAFGFVFSRRSQREYERTLRAGGHGGKLRWTLDPDAGDSGKSPSPVEEKST